MVPFLFTLLACNTADKACFFLLSLLLKDIELLIKACVTFETYQHSGINCILLSSNRYIWIVHLCGLDHYGSQPFNSKAMHSLVYNCIVCFLYMSTLIFSLLPQHTCLQCFSVVFRTLDSLQQLLPKFSYACGSYRHSSLLWQFPVFSLGFTGQRAQLISCHTPILHPPHYVITNV